MTAPEIEELKRLVEDKYGKGLNTTTDFEEFSFKLNMELNLSVSASTLKRLWGYVGDKHKPRIATLDVLADYIGHTDFKTFKQYLRTSTRYNSSFFDTKQLLSSSLHEGEEIRIGWLPNRVVRVMYHGNSLYEVKESRNSKLQVGDRFVTGCFLMGQPLFLPYIERNGSHTAAFVAGRNGGLTVMEVVK